MEAEFSPVGLCGAVGWADKGEGSGGEAKAKGDKGQWIRSQACGKKRGNSAGLLRPSPFDEAAEDKEKRMEGWRVISLNQADSTRSGSTEESGMNDGVNWGEKAEDFAMLIGRWGCNIHLHPSTWPAREASGLTLRIPVSTSGSKLAPYAK